MHYCKALGVPLTLSARCTHFIRLFLAILFERGLWNHVHLGEPSVLYYVECRYRRGVIPVGAPFHKVWTRDSAAREYPRLGGTYQCFSSSWIRHISI
jgi:hypothetical protein